MTKYNHMFDVAFAVVSEIEDPSKIPYEVLIQGLKRRLEVLENNPSEGLEAFGHCDTFKYEDGDIYIDMQGAILIADSSRGVWIPKFVIENYQVENLDDDEREILSDPYHEDHHEVLESMLKNAVVIIRGKKYSLLYDEDMYAVPLGKATD